MSIPCQKLRKSQSMIDIENSKPKTFRELLCEVENNQEENREPCTISLRRIEAKRRSLLQDNQTQQMVLGTIFK